MSRQYESYRPYALTKSRTRVGTEEAKMMRSSIRSAMDSTVIAQNFVAVLGKAYYPPLSHCRVRSATTKLNPTDRQTPTPPTPRQDGIQKQALINELLIQASKNTQNIESSISVTSCWLRPRLSSYTMSVFKFLCLLSF